MYLCIEIVTVASSIALPMMQNLYRAHEQEGVKSAVTHHGGHQRMRVSRYRPVVYVQLLFLFIDIFINSFGELFRTADVVLLVLYM